MEKVLEYKSIIKSKTAAAVRILPEQIPELRLMDDDWYDFLGQNNLYMQVYQEELEQSGLYTKNLASCQAVVSSTLETAIQLLEDPHPLFAFDEYAQEHADRFSDLMDRLIGYDCLAETDAEVRLTLKLEALELWDPLLELGKFREILSNRLIEISESGAAIQELNNKVIQEDFSLAQGAGRLRPL